MTYELAEKLKDAGFPIKTTTTMGGLVPETTVNPNTALIGPTLSELIEACDGKCDNFRLSHWSIEWVAGDWMNYVDDWKNDMRGEGTTPEEAVANLWLALNENK